MRPFAGRGTEALAAWSPRRIAVALVASGAFALAIGIPTGVLPTPLYTRMTPVLWWNYPIWAVTAVLSGLVTATYVRRPGEARARNGVGSASGGGLLAAFAVGCPVCNKLVVAALGVSGALTIWAPLQPLLGAASVALLGWALRRRLRSMKACALPPGQPAATSDADRQQNQSADTPLAGSPGPDGSQAPFTRHGARGAQG